MIGLNGVGAGQTGEWGGWSGVDGGIDRDEGKSGNFLKSEVEDLNDRGRVVENFSWTNVGELAKKKQVDSETKGRRGF